MAYGDLVFQITQLGTLNSFGVNDNYIYLNDPYSGYEVYRHSINGTYLSSLAYTPGSSPTIRSITANDDFVFACCVSSGSGYPCLGVGRSSATLDIPFTTIISGGYGDGQIATTAGLYATGSHLYIADTGNHRIQKTDLNGNFIIKKGVLGSGSGELNAPASIWYADGKVYVADYGNHRVCVFTDDTFDFIFSIGSYGSGDENFNKPVGVATDNAFIYVADQGNIAIKRFLLDGTFYDSIPVYGQVGTSAVGNIYATPTRIYEFGHNPRIFSVVKNVIPTYANLTFPLTPVVGSSGVVFPLDFSINSDSWTTPLTLPMTIEVEGKTESYAINASINFTMEAAGLSTTMDMTLPLTLTVESWGVSLNMETGGAVDTWGVSSPLDFSITSQFLTGTVSEVNLDLTIFDWDIDGLLGHYDGEVYLSFNKIEPFMDSWGLHGVLVRGNIGEASLVLVSQHQHITAQMIAGLMEFGTVRAPVDMGLSGVILPGQVGSASLSFPLTLGMGSENVQVNKVSLTMPVSLAATILRGNVGTVNLQLIDPRGTAVGLLGADGTVVLNLDLLMQNVALIHENIITTSSVDMEMGIQAIGRRVYA